MSNMDLERKKETVASGYENLGADVLSPVLGYAISSDDSGSHFTTKTAVVLFAL